MVTEEERVQNIIAPETKISHLITQIPSKNNIYELTYQKVRKDENKKEEKPKTYSAKYGVLSKFGGLKDLLSAAQKAISLWQTSSMKEVWGHWLSEIMSFSSLPGFFEMFFSERQY